MTQFQYKLCSKGIPKGTCPKCGKKRHWVRFINTITGELLPIDYGRCDNQVKCGHLQLPPDMLYSDTVCNLMSFSAVENYSEKAFKVIDTKGKKGFVPKGQVYDRQGNDLWLPTWLLKDSQFSYAENEVRYYDKNHNAISEPHNLLIKATTTSQSFIPIEVLQQTLSTSGFSQNVFIQNLAQRVPYPFLNDDIERVISQYFLGTVQHGYRAGAITFPYIDITGKIRAIQVKEFDSRNHTIGTDFLHSIIEKFYTRRNVPLPRWLMDYLNNELIVSCLFGEHLLGEFEMNPIALVEAPKTAIYGTLYFGFPDVPKNFLWLAVYNLSSLNYEKVKRLQGRNVYLFPDLSKDGHAFELWRKKAAELTKLMPTTKFVVSDILENYAPQRLKEDGSDIADVIIQMDWRQYRSTEKEPIPANGSVNGEKSEPLEKTFSAKREETTTQETEPHIPIPKNLMEQIVKHYHSYKSPYDINNPGNLESLVSGFIFETDIDIDASTYRTAVQHHQQSMDSNGKSERE